MFNAAQFDGRRLLGWCVMLAAIVLLGLVAQRALFLMRAQHTTGTVAHLGSKNDLCGIGRTSHECTRFYAQLNFDDTLGIAPATVAAGDADGHDVPLSHAIYRVGEALPVLYNPNHPTQVHVDSFLDLWGSSVKTFLVLIFTLMAYFYHVSRGPVNANASPR
jgi:hypothetical protein